MPAEPKLEIIVAPTAGFCFGVKRALRLARRAAKKAKGEVYTLGPIIHNPQTVKELEKEGVVAVKDASQLAGGVVVVRSHGITREELESAREKGLGLVDATCPYVRQVQETVEKLTAEGYQVVIVGDPDHPEVRGILSYVQKGEGVKVVPSEKEARAFKPASRVALVAQTTQSWQTFLKVLTALAPRVKELRVFNTICLATSDRQREAQELARVTDGVIVVGGHNSANTGRLTELCKQIQANTHQVETAQEIKGQWLAGCKKVGVAAGASTPRERVEEVVERLASWPDNF